jgi:DNA-binding MarR family transcriptional regulator
MPNRGPGPDIPDERLLFEIMLVRGPAAFASEIEEQISLSRQRITKRLNDLEDEDLAVSKRAAGRRLWWVTDSGKAKASAHIRDKLS